MRRDASILGVEPFYCVHISNEDKKMLNTFTAANPKSGFLVTYLKEYALSDEDNNMARTYLIYDERTDELVAYFSLRAGFVAINDRRVIIRRGFDTVPGLEISNFAVNGSYVEAHENVKGLLGYYIFRSFIIPIAQRVSEMAGIKILYIFALPRQSLINRYTEYGFVRLPYLQEVRMHSRIRPRYDSGCIFMYQVLPN